MSLSYPTPVFCFKVTCKKFPDDEFGFSEVAGLNQELAAIDYRGGNYKELSVIKVPGLRKYSNITLKRGIVSGQSQLFEWLNNYSEHSNRDERLKLELHIALNNDKGDPVMQWDVTGALPVKIEGPQLKAAGNEIAIEAIELACEKIALTMTKS